MKIKTFFILVTIIGCVIIYSCFAVKKENGQEFAVSIDMSKPLSIEWPCEVSIVGDGGEKGLRIAPNVGRGWRGEAGGKADYRFFIPEEGKYHIWAYCLWFDECANAVFAQIDDQDKAIIGNDPIYNEWHWVRGFDISLTRGTHSLVLSNHSDNIALQKIVFSNSAVVPQQTGLVFSDIFYEGFDGCDQGNFTSWKQIEGLWKVENPGAEMCLIENSMIGQSNIKAFINYPNSQWQEYCLDVSVKVISPVLQNSAVGICFGLTDANNFYELKIKPISNGNHAKASIIDRHSVSISDFELPFEINKWQEIQISLKEGFIEVASGENPPIKIQISEKIMGGIGLILEGKITGYFDNIHVREITHNKKQEL